MALVVFGMLSVGCKKNKILTDPSAQLSFSSDTIFFDTIFSEVGSVTRSFRIRNPHNQALKISSVELAQGAGSQFRINIDGIPSTRVEDLEILANDSVWVFVEVTVDPISQNTPYVIEDSIVFITNGNVQDVNLVAWGQEAVFFRNESIACDTTWRDEKPFVVYGGIQIDSGCTLTITEGCRVHMHGGASVFVDGTLNILGVKDSLVTFEDDRLESEISDKPGMWGGIYYLRGSGGNVNYAVIKNSTAGLSAGFSKAAYTVGDAPDVSNPPVVNVNNSVVFNTLGTGITGFAANISLTNTLVFNAGGYCFQGVLGGTYTLEHVTLANYGSFFVEHKTPVLAMANNFVDAAENTFIAHLNARVENSIVEGNLSSGEEIVNSSVAGADFNVVYAYNILRTGTSLGTSNLHNVGPVFTDRAAGDFSLKSSSPAVDAGNAALGIGIDLLGNPRDGSPDIGAFEYIP